MECIVRLGLPNDNGARKLSFRAPVILCRSRLLPRGPLLRVDPTVLNEVLWSVPIFDLLVNCAILAQWIFTFEARFASTASSSRLSQGVSFL